MNWKSHITSKENYLFFWVLLLFVSLLYSKTLILISMVMLLLPIFINLQLTPFKIEIFQGSKNKLIRYWNNQAHFVIGIVFWISAFSIFNSDNKETWQFFTLMKLPFLLLAPAFLEFKALSKKKYHSLLMAYIVILFISSFPILFDIFNNQENILENISSGRSIETPIDHIKYSLFVSFAIICGVIIFMEKHILNGKLERLLILAILLYLIIFIHLLAVRSGLIILYANLILFFIVNALKQKKYLQGILIMIFILLIPITAYFSVPTFREKLSYSLKDFQMHQADREVSFSDGERFRSYQVGWELIEESPVTGHGVGDMFDEYASLYHLKYFINSPTKLPHNQFMTYTVGTGILGLIFFIISFVFPFFYKKAIKDPVLLALFLLMLLSFIVENTLERQYSVGFYLVFLLLGLNARQKPGNKN